VNPRAPVGPEAGALHAGRRVETMSMSELFGEPIYSYTSRQAIEDGVLFEPFPDKFPGALFTAGVHAAIERAIQGSQRTYAQAAIPLLMDAAMVCRAAPSEDLWTDGLHGNVTGSDVWIGRNDLGSFTIMFPEEN